MQVQFGRFSTGDGVRGMVHTYNTVKVGSGENEQEYKFETTAGFGSNSAEPEVMTIGFNPYGGANSKLPLVLWHSSAPNKVQAWDSRGPVFNMQPEIKAELIQDAKQLYQLMRPHQNAYTRIAADLNTATQLGLG